MLSSAVLRRLVAGNTGTSVLDEAELVRMVATAIGIIVDGNVSADTFNGLPLAAVATSGSASDLGIGTLPIARVADAAVTLAKLADLANAVVIGRNTAGTGVPEAVTMAQLLTLAGLDWTTVTASGNVTDLATTLSMSGAEQCYRFAWSYTQNGGSAPDFRLEPNSDSANASCTFQGKVGSTTTVINVAALAVGGGAAAGARSRGGGFIYQAGGISHWFYSYVVDNGTATHIERYTVVGTYYGGTITGLRLHATVASAIASGAVLRVAKVF